MGQEGKVRTVHFRWQSVLEGCGMEEVAMKLILSEQRYGLTSSNDN
jgi:hypothetical protein